LAATVILPLGRANSAPPNPLAGLEGPLPGREKGRREGERKEMKGTVENTREINLWPLIDYDRRCPKNF